MGWPVRFSKGITLPRYSLRLSIRSSNYPRVCLPLSLRRSGAHKLSITFTRTPPHPHRHTLSATPEQHAHTSVIIIFAFFTSLQHITSYYLVIYTSHATLIFSLSVNTRTSACSFLPHASKVPPIST